MSTSGLPPVRLAVGVEVLGGCGLVVDDEFEFDWGEPAESSLSSPAMVGPLDPVHDPRLKFGACAPAPPVQDVLLEQ